MATALTSELNPSAAEEIRAQRVRIGGLGRGARQ